eukprot:280828-Pyramimonas_sp.AAC.1
MTRGRSARARSHYHKRRTPQPRRNTWRSNQDYNSHLDSIISVVLPVRKSTPPGGMIEGGHPTM